MSLPVIDLASLMDCPLSLNIDAITWTEEPLIQEGAGRYATSIKAEGHGFLSSPDLATLATDITALENNSRISGVDFTVSGPAEVTLHTLSASDCYEGGPHISFTILDDDGGLYRSCKFTVVAKAHYFQLLHTWRIKTATAIDGLVTIDQEGSIGPAAMWSSFAATVLPAFKATYPPANYLITFDVDYPYGKQTTDAGTNTTIAEQLTRYHIHAVQLATALPTGGSVVVVDGELNIRKDTDEQQRVTTITEWQLQLQPNVGDYTSLVNALRPAAGTLGTTQLISESVSFSNIKAWKLKCSYTQLGSADGDGLLNYTRTVNFIPNEQSYEIYAYPGATPIAVARPTTFTRITDTGSMTALAEFVDAPAPLLSYYEQPPTFKYTDVSNFEKRLDWEMSMIDVTGSFSITDALAAIQRPGSVSGGVP